MSAAVPVTISIPTEWTTLEVDDEGVAAALAKGQDVGAGELAQLLAAGTARVVRRVRVRISDQAAAPAAPQLSTTESVAVTTRATHGTRSSTELGRLLGATLDAATVTPAGPMITVVRKVADQLDDDD